MTMFCFLDRISRGFSIRGIASRIAANIISLALSDLRWSGDWRGLLQGDPDSLDSCHFYRVIISSVVLFLIMPTRSRLHDAKVDLDTLKYLNTRAKML
jgi:hypothetical protein